MIIVLAGLGVGGYFVFGRGSNPGASATATPAPTATPTQIPALYQDALTQDKGGWDCSATTCSFRSDGYHVQAPDNHVYVTLLTKPFNNAAIEVKGLIGKGDPKNASAGITFRVPLNAQQAGYGLLVFDDGSYGLVKWDKDGNPTTLIDINTPSSAIHSGLNQENDLKLVMNGSTFTIYINGQQVNQATDSTYQNGYIGLLAGGKGTEAIYTDLLVTKPAA